MTYRIVSVYRCLLGKVRVTAASNELLLQNKFNFPIIRLLVYVSMRMLFFLFIFTYTQVGIRNDRVTSLLLFYKHSLHERSDYTS